MLSFWKQAPPICGQGQAGPRLFLKLAGAGREGDGAGGAGDGAGGAGGRGWGGAGGGLGGKVLLLCFSILSPGVTCCFSAAECSGAWLSLNRIPKCRVRGDILCSTCHKGNSHQEKGTKFIFKRPSNS